MFGRDGRTNRADQLNMTEGSVLPLILRFALPIFVGSVFQQIYSVVDTMMAGHVLGDGAIAAIGATSTLYGLIIQISLGLAGGFVLVITRCFGAGQPFRLRRALATTFTLGGIIALLMTGISVTFLRPFMRMLNTPDSIFEQAHSYMIIICGGLTATMGYNLFAGVMRAFGNSRTPLYALIFSCLPPILPTYVLDIGGTDALTGLMMTGLTI